MKVTNEKLRYNLSFIISKRKGRINVKNKERI